MRRKDRQTDEKTAYEIFDKAPFATVAFSGKAYCVPVSTALLNGYVYFHCANEGMKLDRLKENPDVCISAVSYCEPIGEKFTMAYSSAIITGTAETVTDKGEKTDALRVICEKYAPENMNGFDKIMENSSSVTEVIRVTIKEISGKQNTARK